MEINELFKKIESLEKKVASLEQRKPGLLLNYFKKAFMKTHVIAGVAIAAIASGAILYAATVLKPYDFTDGTTIYAGEVNDNFDTLYDLVNGNLDDDNISGIDASKVSTGKLNAQRLPTPIIWSGGCSNHGIATGQNIYCTDSTDFNTAAGYLSVATNGTITVVTGGYYRINIWVISRGVTYGPVQILKNEVTIHYGYNFIYNDNFFDNRGDVIWPFSAGDTIQVRIQNPGSYAYHSWNASGMHSRLQVMYVGPN